MIHSLEIHGWGRKNGSFPWGRYALDTLLAFLGSMGVTVVIYFFHLYPRIPNISIVYLLVVLPLSITRGRYSAMLTSVIAFLTFDFFLVPPLYMFTINRPEEWIALFIFLIDALLTGQFPAALRERTEMAALKRTDALRAALLSSVSHDLRTPLTSIKAAASSLLQDDVEWTGEERASFLHSIENEADRLNRLVANLLDMSRIEEGKLCPDKDWYSLKSLIHDVLGRMAPQLAGRAIQLDLPDELLMVELDYLHIDQVLTNLLENITRYTPPDSPITVRARQNGRQVLLSVADRGPGIPQEHLEHVFDKFYRVLHGSVANGATPGSGLGLAVCKGLVEAHGGRIWAEARPEGGLTVQVALPCAALERIEE